MNVKDKFDLSGKIALITGGAGFLGVKHAEAIKEMGGTPILLDLKVDKLNELALDYNIILCDITAKCEVERAISSILVTHPKIDILINNAFMTIEQGLKGGYFAPFEEYPLHMWTAALKTNLTGTFLITQAVGRWMVRQGGGVILNIASDVGVISPDHRIYEGMPFNTPLSYSISKAAIIQFTKYLATYWADKNIRVNSLTPAGVYDGQPPEFVKRLSNLIPMGRMADRDEYKGAVSFLVSDASSFMTGANLIVDGGRTCW